MRVVPIRKKSESGIGLVEVIFALGVSIIVITSLVSLSLFTLRSSLQSKLLLRGTRLATQEIENVRALRDTMVEDTGTSWQDFVIAIRTCNSSGFKCYVDPNIGSMMVHYEVNGNTITVDNQTVYVYFYATNTDDTAISGSPPYPDVVKISVTASWRLGNRDNTVHNYTNLSNWRGD